MAKFVYVVRSGQFMIVKDKFEFYGSEIFTSHARAQAYIDNVIKCNKGFNREKDYHYNDCIPVENRFGSDKLLNYQVDYKWRGEGPDGQVTCKARLHVEQKALNYGE